jgi:SAM-dependent methyltransferase
MSVTCIHATGDGIPQENFDIVLSIGVIHHIPVPDSVLSAAYQATRPGGRCLIWVYGREGNELYLLASRFLRLVCHRVPRRIVKVIAGLLVLPLSLYAFVCRHARLPMSRYRNVSSRMRHLA